MAFSCVSVSFSALVGLPETLPCTCQTPRTRDASLRLPAILRNRLPTRGERLDAREYKATSRSLKNMNMKIRPNSYGVLKKVCLTHMDESPSPKSIPKVVRRAEPELGKLVVSVARDDRIRLYHKSQGVPCRPGQPLQAESRV